MAPGLALIALGTLSGGAPIGARPTASYNLYPPLNYVVLGDSVSAGEGIGYQYRWSGYQTQAYGITVSDGQWYLNGAAPTWEDPNYGTTCHRSTQAFGFQLRDMLQPYLNGRSMNVTHLGCTGATTDNVLASPQSHPDTNPALPTVPFGQLANPAYDAAQPDLVSLSVGANDLDFANIVKTCFTPWVFGGWQCGDDSSLQISQKMDHIAANLPPILQTIWDKGMAAGKIPEVLLMTYYDPFPDRYALCNDMSFKPTLGSSPSPARPRSPRCGRSSLI